jgi:hypothetical protein
MKNKNRVMRIFLLSILNFCLLSTSLPAFPQETAEESIEMSYTIAFPVPVIEKVPIGERIFDTVTIDDLPNVGDYGEPIVPVKELRLLIPYGYIVISIDANPGELITLGSGYILRPGSKNVPLSEIENAPLPTPDDEIYKSPGMFPGNLFDIIGTYGFRGYQILYITLNPVQYTPLTGELSYYPNITMNLHLNKVEKVAINHLFRDSDSDRNQLKDKVDNFEESQNYPSLKRQTRDDYDLLIITTDALKTCFEPLAEYHSSHGVPTLIATLSDIGSTDPEAIRSYIRDAYLNQNIEYVLLGGDSDIVPARMLWVTSGYGDTTEMPADLYYGCLDGTYNFDGDDRWGEPHDGENGGDVDLVAEVYIGRACVGDSFEVDNFIQKTVSYVYTVDPYLSKVLMAGEFLWSNPDTWGGDYMDELIDGSTANGYNTTGIPSDEYTIDKLYDRDWPGNDWPKEEIINRINDNVHIINHLGHSSYNYNMKMYSEDAVSLTNTRYFFAYSQGCDNGGFDNPYGTDCIAEHFTVKTDHGAFAVIANARYGFGASGSTDGANQRYHREFIDAIFGEGIIQLGRANQDSKEDNLYKIHMNPMRWCYYEINLLGDPTIDFFTHYNNSAPSTPGAPVGPTNGEVGVEYNYTIHANADPEGDVTYYKFYWGDGKTSQWLGPCNPSETVSAQHIWDTAGTYDVVVKCRDGYWGMSNFSNPLPVEITGPFFEIGRISGGLLKASAEIKNIGAGAATNVKRSITVEGVHNKKIFVVTNSTIDLLGSGETTLAQTDKPLLGFGKVRIIAVAYAPGGEKFSKTVNGYVLFCLVFVVQ